VDQFTTCWTAAGAPCPPADLTGCVGHNDYRGWWSASFAAHILFYDPDDLALVASGSAAPHAPQPYAVLDIDRYLLHNPGLVELEMIGTGIQRRFRLGETAYDRARALLYVLELFADGTKPVVHVFALGPSTPAPTITAFTPTGGPVGTAVSIAGTNLTGATSVLFYGTAASFTVDSATSITTTVPAGAWTGPISVTTPDGTATSAAPFVVSTPRSFHTLTPCRAVDTRGADGPALAAGASRVFPLRGRCGIPATAGGVSVNVTVTSATTMGNVRLFPAGVPMPTVSTINYVAGLSRANNAVTALSGSGELAVHCSQAAGTVQFILDVNGYME
jgi:hypothetical protein